VVLSCALRGLRPSPVRGPRGHRRGVASGCKHPSSASGSLPLSFEASAQLPGPSRRTDRNRSSDRATKALPLLGFVTSLPLHRHTLARPLPGTRVAPSSHRADGTTRPAPCSVLVVLHHLDGFLRAKDRGLVASRCRSWGSPRFSKPSPSILSTDPKAIRKDRGEEGLVPAARISTLRRVPPARSRTVSPRPVPPCRWMPPGGRRSPLPIAGRRK
jgi:hypothetical protein